MTSTIQDRQLEFFGPVKMVHCDLDVTNYDNDGSGDGELFAPQDVGLNRVMHVRAGVIDGTAVEAVYDESTGAVRLFEQANDGNGTANDPLTEVPSNANETATVQLTVMGK